MPARRDASRSLLAVSAVLALLAASSATAGAQEETEESNSQGVQIVSIVGSSLSSATVPIVFSAVTLDGSDSTPTGSATWAVNDSRGTGTGWNITLVATDFTGTFGELVRTVDISEPDQDLLVRVESINTSSGNTAPTTPAASDTSVPFTGETPLKILTAAVNTGMGVYTYVPTFTLKFPAEGYAVSYSGTITVTLSAVP
ncbi:MAG: WxL domain-containing protein [Acidimicrobiia bacterium]|nr:WxL domain-containing protein [Actinomycetota bacterium]MBL6925354.1 WxL domain-containing protein [Acidimicrobiia bacterium]